MSYSQCCTGKGGEAGERRGQRAPSATTGAQLTRALASV